MWIPADRGGVKDLVEGTFLLGMYRGQFFTEYQVPSNKKVFCRVRVPSTK